MSGCVVRANGWQVGIEEQYLAVNPVGEVATLWQTNSEAINEDDALVKVSERGGFENIQCLQYSAANPGLTAVGQLDGCAHIFDITSPQHSLLTLKPRQARSCNSISFNENGLVVLGYDRGRQDHSIQVWDVQHYSRTTKNDHINKPLITYIPNESISSISFCPSEPSNFLAGTYKLLREFDVRAQQPIYQLATRCTSHISVDPFSPHLFASTSEDGSLAIWDRRKLTDVSQHQGTSIMSESPALSFNKLLNDHQRKSGGAPYKFSSVVRGELGALFDGDLVRRWQIGACPPLKSEVERYEEIIMQNKQENPGFSSRTTKPLDSIFVSKVSDVKTKYERVISFDYAPNLNAQYGIELVCMRQSGSIYKMPVTESQTSIAFNSFNDLTFSGPYGTCSKMVKDINNNNNHRASIDDDDDNNGLFKVDALLGNDICSTIRRRAVLNYGTDANKNMSILDNLMTIETQAQLRDTWKWISISYDLVSTGKMISGDFDFGYLGVLGIWNMEKGFETLTRFNGKDRFTEKQLMDAAKKIVDKRASETKILAAEVTGPSIKSFKEIQRKLAMYVIGWDFGVKELEDKYESLISNENHERAAGWAVFHGDIARAVQILADSKKESYRIMSTAIAGYFAFKDSQVNNTWKDQCRKLSSDLENPYLRVIFAYIADSNWWDVLDDSSLPLRERLGVALRFLSDSELNVYLNRLAQNVINRGEIEGIILTGITEKGINLLQSFVDRTSDIQSASLIASYGCPKYFQDDRVESWIESYRELLNSWSLFAVRAKFDVSRTKLSRRINGQIQTKPVPRQVYLQCSNCHKNISKKKDAARLPSHICPHCGYPLTRCAICLITQGIPIPKELVHVDNDTDKAIMTAETQFKEWFSFYPVITDILRKIERERNIALGASNLRKETSNAMVIQKCNTSIREAQKNIEYLEQTLKKLRSQHASEQALASKEADDSNLDDDATLNDKDRSNKQLQVHTPTFTVLDLLKYECPSLGHRIQYMLQLLEFKIQVEEQYREANEKIYKLYQMEGDRRSIAAAADGRIEGDRKVQLMKKSLKQYQSMYIDIDEVSRDVSIINTFRKNPLTGLLNITITTVRNVDHIASPLFSRNPESIVTIKIDDVERTRTKASRNDRWNENFEIDVERANEVGITVYDKSGDQLIPVGLAWLPLSDIAEEMRRKKVTQERGNSTEWISASSLRDAQAPSKDMSNMSLTSSTTSTGHMFHNGNDGQSASTSNSSSSTGNNNSISSTCWFELEPTGQVLVTISFTKANENKAGDGYVFGGGLGRHGAIRQAKEDVHEYHGHKFVQKQFYNIMACAVCGDFLRYTGFQCTDCRFLCHKKCYKNVINKCISISSTDTSADEAKLNHRIPHRFEPVANRGTRWCCHCGYILPWGRKQVRKCSECSIMCHAACLHLVPDFCGMSIEKASQILSAIKSTQEHRVQKPQGRISNQTTASNSAMASRSTLDVSSVQKRDPYSLPSSQYPDTAVTKQSVQLNQSKYQDGTLPKIPDDNGIIIPATYPRPQQQQQQQQQQQSETTSNLDSSKQKQQQQQVVQKVPQQQHHRPKQRRQRHRYGLDDFNFLAVLGKGNFGKVMLAESVHSKQLCAIKVLKKDFIIQNDEVESTKSEKRVFLIANKGNHPFLLNLHQCFQTENRIYFVMEYITGGDLMWHVQQKRFSLKRAQFYAAEVLLALKFLHENGVVYRDLKLDNILLTIDGHIKLADYGLCKENMWHGNKTSTFCGTPELMAPEILKEQGYDKAVDWWAFGVLLYQMLLTKSPFKGEDEDEVFNAILTDEPLYPINMARDAVDILQRLLTRDPTQRLGSGPTDAEEIMAHPYFANINFDDIFHCRTPAPYLPDVKDPRDPTCFDEEFTSQAAKLTPVNSLLSPSKQEMFRGFTYVNDENSI
ncbi:hypothetical protein CANARDRAFT_176000 [[Candida] arabinofermentans NRRL YB-2248]|uniref:Protein kinase C-like 1 n=1 Tax=[Candida] arabinofermentans NRRL YB-2248 TaxID=983967 RepID=A0A1E4T1F8_9ASCO|nr:hypothetical protein CANARDRAFT_176000 [[Candida] arabinofermentans NRRL YB-2248]